MSEGKYNGDGVKHYRSLDRETRKKFRRLHRRSIKSLSSLSFSSLFTGNNIIDENYKSRRQSMQKSKHTMNMHPVVEKAMERMTRRSTSAELPPCHAPLTPSSMRLPHSPSPRVSCSSSRPAPARCAADSQPPQVTQAFSRKCGSSIYSPANRARSKKYTPDSNKSRSMRVRATTATSSSPRQGRRRYRLSLPQYQNGGEGLGADGFKLGGKGISVDTGINFVKRRNDAIEIDDDGKKEDDPSDSNDSKDGTSDTNRADKPLKKEAHAVEIKDNHARNVEDAGNGNGVNNDGTDNNSGALAMFVTLNPALQNLSASDVSPPSSSSSPPSLSPSPSSLSLSPRFSSVPPPSLQSKTSDSITKATHKLKKPNKDELFMNSVMKTKDGKENWAKWEENEDTEKRRNIGHHDCTSNDNASATEAVVDTVNINRCDEKENKYGDSSNIDRGNSSSHGQDDLYNANSSPSIIIPVEKGGKEEIARECADRSESCRGNSPCAMSRSQPASSPASPPSPTRCADKDRNNHNHNCHGVDTPSTHSLPLPPSSSHQASFSNLVSITDDKWALPEDEHAGRLGVTVLYNQGQAPTTRTSWQG